MRRLFPQPVISDTYNDDAAATDVCTDVDAKLGPDADLGRKSEGTPYGE